MNLVTNLQIDQSIPLLTGVADSPILLHSAACELGTTLPVPSVAAGTALARVGGGDNLAKQLAARPFFPLPPLLSPLLLPKTQENNFEFHNFRVAKRVSMALLEPDIGGRGPR